jgi:hypothetical protein
MVDGLSSRDDLGAVVIDETAAVDLRTVRRMDGNSVGAERREL